MLLQRKGVWEEMWIFSMCFMKQTWEKVNRYKMRGFIEDECIVVWKMEGHTLGEEYSLRRG